MLSIIVAASSNNVIGAGNSLLWHISADLRRFKDLTTGNTVVMGRKTFESLPKRPLPNRRNIVITRNADFAHAGVEVAHSVNEVLSMVSSDDKTFIIGGEQIYRQFLPIADKVYLTRVLHEFQGDAFFPDLLSYEFELTNSSERFFDEKSNLSYFFQEFCRCK